MQMFTLDPALRPSMQDLLDDEYWYSDSRWSVEEKLALGAAIAVEGVKFRPNGIIENLDRIVGRSKGTLQYKSFEHIRRFLIRQLEVGFDFCMSLPNVEAGCELHWRIMLLQQLDALIMRFNTNNLTLEDVAPLVLGMNLTKPATAPAWWVVGADDARLLFSSHNVGLDIGEIFTNPGTFFGRFQGLPGAAFPSLKWVILRIQILVSAFLERRSVLAMRISSSCRGKCLTLTFWIQLRVEKE
jgi:hypothetical protein